MGVVGRAQDQLLKIASRYPFAGPAFWILSVQYFIVQLMVAAAWPVAYDWRNNYISDLGNTECGIYQGLYVCSPLHMVMNASFVLFGISMALGAVLIYEQFIRTRLSLVGFILMVLAGTGTVLVGLFPENNPNGLHTFGAVLGLGIGNVSIVVLGMALNGMHPIFRTYTILSGIVSLTAFVLFIADIYFGLGRGGMERVVSYPFTVWMIAFGAYMTIVRIHDGNRHI